MSAFGCNHQVVLKDVKDYSGVLYVGRNWSKKRIVDLPLAGLIENCRKPD